MTTLIIVIIVLLSVLTTPLTLKALIDRDKAGGGKLTDGNGTGVLEAGGMPEAGQSGDPQDTDTEDNTNFGDYEKGETENEREDGLDQEKG